MGLIQAAAGAIGGALADQWKDFYTIPSAITSTTALVSAEKRETNRSRGSNTSASRAIVTKGSKFVVPEGYGLILIQNGAFTGFVAEPGAYTWDPDDLDAKSIFAGNGIVSPLIKNSWERFKFSGRPQSEQQAIFVSLQELANNKFGSLSDIYWDDKYLNTQVGARVRGTYTIRIVDPLIFVHNFVPNAYLQTGNTFDFTDINNAAAQQLFNEVIGSLASAFASYANAPNKENRMSKIQQDATGFGKSLSGVVEESFNWKNDRGIEIVSTAVVSIEYDESTKEIIKTVQRSDALAGTRGNSNLQASVAAGIEAAGSTEGSAGILGIGFAAGSLGLGSLQQSVEKPASRNPNSNNMVFQMQQLKEMLDSGLITEDDFNAAKARLLGL